MKTSVIGVLSEKIVTIALLRLGYQVSIPVDPGSPYDLLVDNGTRILKIQVKTARKQTTNTITFHTMNRKGEHYKHSCDLFVVYYPETEALFSIPASHVADTPHATILLEGGKSRSDSRGLTESKYLLENNHTQTVASEETTIV